MVDGSASGWVQGSDREPGSGGVDWIWGEGRMVQD